MEQKELDIQPPHKKVKPDSYIYSELKTRMNDKFTHKKILIFDRGHTRINKCNGYFSLDYWNNKDLIRWYPDGTIKIDLGGLSVHSLRNRWSRGSSLNIRSATKTGIHTDWSVTTRLTRFIPHPITFTNYIYHTMVRIGNDESYEAPQHMTIMPDGTIKEKLGPSRSELHEIYKKQYQLRSKTRRRGQYWVRRARNLYLKRCGKGRRNGCRLATTWPRPNGAAKLECGCVFYRKNIKFNYTAQEILKEKNATVRTAMIKLYGIQKFFDDVGARVIAKAREYQLLCMEFGRARTNRPLTQRDQRQLKLHALKMVCPSTGQIYVNLVPNNITGVEAALNWMFNTRNYFGTVGKET